jgi:hypothetical protein
MRISGGEDALRMHFGRKNCASLARLPLILFALLPWPATARAVTCTSQAEIPAADRDQIAASALQLAVDIGNRDSSALENALLPSETGSWEAIHAAADQAANFVKGGQMQIRNVYLLDATMLTAPADSQFFCSDSTGSLTVTLTMRSLPPGRYAVVLADAAGAPLAGQLGFILGSAPQGWKLGGFSARQGAFGGHDGVWYWSQARDAAKGGSDWSAYYLYDTAHYLLVPVDFLSSPNLQKLDQEQSQLTNSPREAFPVTLTDGPRTWKVDSVGLDTTLNEPDLGVVYESMGVTDPGAARTEAVAVLSALLKAHPDLRQSFHGLWAYAMNGGKRTFAIELPMTQIQ